MHEFGLTQRIVKAVIDAANRHGARRVLEVNLVVGENTSVVPGSVQLYFDAIAKGTVAEGARLAVRAVPCRMLCPSCGKRFVRPRFSFACPDCGALGGPTGEGDELYVESVELETGDEDEVRT